MSSLDTVHTRWSLIQDATGLLLYGQFEGRVRAIGDVRRGEHAAASAPGPGIAAQDQGTQSIVPTTLRRTLCS